MSSRRSKRKREEEKSEEEEDEIEIRENKKRKVLSDNVELVENIEEDDEYEDLEDDENEEVEQLPVIIQPEVDIPVTQTPIREREDVESQPRTPEVIGYDDIQNEHLLKTPARLQGEEEEENRNEQLLNTHFYQKESVQLSPETSETSYVGTYEDDEVTVEPELTKFEKFVAFLKAYYIIPSILILIFFGVIFSRMGNANNQDFKELRGMVQEHDRILENAGIVTKSYDEFFVKVDKMNKYLSKLDNKIWTVTESGITFDPSKFKHIVDKNEIEKIVAQKNEEIENKFLSAVKGIEDVKKELDEFSTDYKKKKQLTTTNEKEIKKINKKLEEIVLLVAEFDKAVKGSTDLNKDKEEIERMIEEIRKEVSSVTSSEVTKIVEEIVSKSKVTRTEDITQLLKDDIEEKVKLYIDKNKDEIFDKDKVMMIVKGEIDMLQADNINRTDYALYTMGGRVVGYNELYETYGSFFLRNLPRPLTALKKYFNKNPVDPNTVLRKMSSVGECFPLAGDSGNIMIELKRAVFPDSFSIDHISKNLSPNPTTAPRRFKVYGLHTKRTKPVYILEGEYNYNTVVQTFHAKDYKNFKRPFKYFRLDILSNHGNEDYTCIYRFRVHGQREDLIESLPEKEK